MLPKLINGADLKSVQKIDKADIIKTVLAGATKMIILEGVS